jgi:DNA-binding NarL/FixJ family response regulator
VKILVVDDHHLIREGLRPLLERLGERGDEAAVMEAASYDEALVYADSHPELDLVLLDLRLPNVSGFAALVDLQERHPDVPVVVMSGEDDPDLMREALERGALGFIPKSSPSHVILNALRLVLAGGTYVPPEIMSAAAFAPRPLRPSPSPDRRGEHQASGGAAERLGLTPRQMDVLALLLAGQPNKLICRELDLAEGTVKNHVAAVLKALNVTTRVQAVIAAAKLGITA